MGEVRDDYFDAGSVEDFLFGQFAGFFGEGLDEDAAAEAGAAALERAVHNLDALDTTVVAGAELASVCLAVEDAEQEIRAARFYRYAPAPEGLMLFCGHHLYPGETLIVVYTYNDGAQASFRELWPFPMETAVKVTTPPDRFRDADPEVSPAAEAASTATRWVIRRLRQPGWLVQVAALAVSVRALRTVRRRR